MPLTNTQTPTVPSVTIFILKMRKKKSTCTLCINFGKHSAQYRPNLANFSRFTSSIFQIVAERKEIFFSNSEIIQQKVRKNKGKNNVRTRNLVLIYCIRAGYSKNNKKSNFAYISFCFLLLCQKHLSYSSACPY